jgi:3-hydroxybutyryl-CoA dehydrogenase
MVDRVVARVGRPLVIEAIRMLEAGEGTVAGIDAALEAAGYPGPFRRLDVVGLDVDLAVDLELKAGSGRSNRFDPPSLQRSLVEEGRLGRITGRGFYRYAHGVAAMPDVMTELAGELSPDATVERLQLGIINEAYRVVEEGLAGPPAVDEAMHAAGHPSGPFELVDQLGMRRVIDRLGATYALTEARSDDQYRVATALWQLATA